MRTTVDIDTSLLAELKELGKTRKESIGSIMSQLLARALKEETEAGGSEAKPLNWVVQDMGDVLLNIEMHAWNPTCILPNMW